MYDALDDASRDAAWKTIDQLDDSIDSIDSSLQDLLRRSAPTARSRKLSTAGISAAACSCIQCSAQSIHDRARAHFEQRADGAR